MINDGPTVDHATVLDAPTGRMSVGQHYQSPQPITLVDRELEKLRNRQQWSRVITPAQADGCNRTDPARIRWHITMEPCLISGQHPDGITIDFGETTVHHPNLAPPANPTIRALKAMGITEGQFHLSAEGNCTLSISNADFRKHVLTPFKYIKRSL